MRSTAYRRAFLHASTRATHIGKSRLHLAILSALAAAPAVVLAQGSESEIEELIVIAEAIDFYDVLPDRETDSVYGTTRSMADTPRSVTLIESPLIDLFGLRTVNDFVAITPGSYTGNYFGVPGALDLRGERADNFFRGFRRVENRGNFPTSIAAAQFVEIIKGPPPLIYGGGKVGGVLNFVPKSAQSKDAALIGEPTRAASLTYGTDAKLLGSFEMGLPFGEEKSSGVYIFAQAESSDHYYDNIYNDNKVIQVAFDSVVSDTVKLEYGFMAQKADLNQSLGWNRVTQELIDSEGASYLAGTPGLNLDLNGDGQLSPSEVEPFDLEQFAFANPFPYFALSAAQRAAFALDPATVHTTSISHRTVQTERSDFSQSDVYTGYFDVVYTSDSDLGWSIKNQTFYDTMDHTKFSSYGFTADYDAYVMENKTTLNMAFSPGDGVSLGTVFGLAYRMSDGVEQESRGRGYQVLDRRDISAGATPNDRFEGAYTGTGNVPYNWVQDGDFSDTGLFAVVDASLGERISLILGARLDGYDAATYGTDAVTGVYASAEDDDSASSYNASMNFEVTSALNLYATYATSEYLELGQGGMVSMETIAGDTWLQDSELAEIGVKGYLADRKLYFSLTGYEQEKTAFNTLSGGFDSYESEGIELEARYAATERLSFTAAATSQETTLQNTPFFLGIPPSALGLNPAQTYGGRFVGVGALIGVPSFVQSPIPEEVFSLNGVFTSDYGWGFSLGATHASSMYTGYLQTVTLPSYTVARAAVFYESPKFSLRLNANNLFDEKYYSPQFLFWDTFVSPSVGRTAEMTFTYEW
jgi:iron complex outermembrane receptor protein